MQLRQFLDIAVDVQPEEVGPFAQLAQQYWEARVAGKRGLLQSDVQEEQVEFLLQLFDHDPGSGTYVHTRIDALLRPTPILDRFGEFWKLYPRKIAKAGALKSWKAKVKSPELADKIIAALAAHIEYHDWTDPERREFAPHATTWLNQERWEDVLPAKLPRLTRPLSGATQAPRDALVGVR